MTDLEMTKLCADAISMRVQLLSPETGFPSCNHYVIPQESEGSNPVWNPLEDDAQAMELVKTLNLSIINNSEDCDTRWSVGPEAIDISPFDVDGDDLNRAIVKCAALMQARAKPSLET